MLCYPLSAFLLLFNATLDGQMSANAQANIAAGAALSAQNLQTLRRPKRRRFIGGEYRGNAKAQD
jgi:hypothetical protein